MKKINQKDIADSLNISRVTVTKALQDHPDIAKKTRDTIKEKALEMGYIPDFIGRSLSSKRTRMIGVVLPKIAHSFFAYSVEKFYEAARRRGYHIIPMISFEDQENELENIRTLLSMRVEGLIIDTAGNCTQDSNYNFAKGAGAKILFYDRCLKDSNDGAILTDDFDGAYKLTKLIIEKGYKKVCHFAGPSSLNIATERQKGYEAAMEECQLSTKIQQVDFNSQSGYDAIMDLACKNELPEAVFSVNDSVAKGIYKAVDELGLKIPDDIAVAGFGDIESSKLLSPPLTTVRIPIDEMVEEAIALLVEMIEDNKEFRSKRIFQSEIIQRGSV